MANRPHARFGGNSTDVLRRTLSLITSARFVTFLFLFLAGLTGLAVLLPYPDNRTAFFSGTVFNLSVILLLASLFSCTFITAFDRIKRDRMWRDSSPHTPAPLRYMLQFRLEQSGDRAALEEKLVRAGYSVVTKKDALLAEKFAIASRGSLIIHLAVVSVMAGAFLGRSFGLFHCTRMTEGGVFNIPEKNKTADKFAFSVFLRKIEAGEESVRNCFSTCRAILTFDDSSDEVTVISGRPLYYRGYQIILLDYHPASLSGDGKNRVTLVFSSDPGLPFVYAGFLMLIIGMYLSFFSSHTRIEILGSGPPQFVLISSSSEKAMRPASIRKKLEFLSAGGKIFNDGK